MTPPRSCVPFETPAGTVYIASCNGKITYIGFEKGPSDRTADPVIVTAEEQLTEYFEGKRKDFTVPFAVTGSGFQKDVCEALMKIPYGETRTYGEIAEAAGRPAAVRAVASAVGRNPISIIIPCHRVIGSDGKMRGYAGGIPFKEHLLETEGWRPRKR